MDTFEKLRDQIRSLKTLNKSLVRELKIIRDKDQQLLRLTDSLYQHISEGGNQSSPSAQVPFDGITFIIVAYNIPRQIERTLMSCTGIYQNIEPSKLEVIIVDNGSDVALKKSDFAKFPRVTKILRIDGKPSPVSGLNAGIAEASFSTIALMIDGAHMLTPGVVANARAVIELKSRPVINVPQYILGRASQNLRTVKDAFDQETEDLRELGWPANGYTLFDYAVSAGEGVNKHYLDAIESNCLITTQEVLESCGGYDERFDEAGAGLANIELYNRLCHDPRNQYVTLPGEGTFHQDHHGTTTSLLTEDRDKLVATYYEKYKQITGNERNCNFRAPFVFGDVSICNRTVPTISREFGLAKNKILRDLSEIYINRVRYDQQGEIPSLTLKSRTADERRIRPVLEPLGLGEGKDAGKYGYRNILKKIHQDLQPRRYFEIGVDDGASISLARCPSVGVDPDFELVATLEYPTQIFRKTSDAFFSGVDNCKRIFAQGMDLAFIDGMHLAEFVLRDFINVEKWAGRDCVVIVDDVFPEQLAMAGRERPFNAWCGDVYKIIPILNEYRPDLELHVFEALAGPYRKGVALIYNLDSSKLDLEKNLEKISEDILGEAYSASSISELEEMVPVTDIDKLGAILDSLRARRRESLESHADAQN